MQPDYPPILFRFHYQIYQMYNLDTFNMWNYPFYKARHACQVGKVKILRKHLTDNLIKILFKEWFDGSDKNIKIM